MSKSISILIPIYNGVEYLDQSLSSIIRQTYKDWEVIIGINGVSSNSIVEEKAMEIVKLLNKDSTYEIRVIYYDTKGKPATLNKMVLDAKYPYIALLDVDDIWIDVKLEKQLKYLDIYDVIGTGCRYFGDYDHYPNLPYGDLRYFNFLQFNPIINSSAIIKKKCAYWNENEFLEDYDLWLRLFKENKKFFNIDECLVLHRIHNDSCFNGTNHLHVEELKNKWSKIL
jgi:glycosyltransferase involved in cell wall biosynthesis